MCKRKKNGLGSFAVVALSVGSFASLASFAPSARAATEASASAGGGLGALGVVVDVAGATVHYRSCPALPCVPDATSPVLTLPFGKEQLPDPRDVVAETVPIGQGRSVVHVHVPARGDQVVGWDAVLAAGTPPIFAGKTGFADGQDGERTGSLVQVLGAGPVKHVLVGSVREELRICGQTETILSPAGLEPSTLALRGATVQRLPPEQREGATRIIAVAHGGPATLPLASLLGAVGASSEVGSFKALTDGNPSTTWAEARPGRGQGEFVTMSAPQEVPITRLSIVVAPPVEAGADPKLPRPEEAKQDAAVAPRSFFLVTTKQTFAVTLPEDGRLHPGAAYDIALPEPVRTSCVALVLDDSAYDHGRVHPEVTLAELYAYSAFDGPSATLDAVASALDGGGGRAEAARATLERAGSPGFAAMAAQYDKLDAAGRALAMQVAASASGCEASAPLLIRGMGDADREVRRKATGKLQNPLCGRAAVPWLVKALDDPAQRLTVASLVASLAPSLALEPLARSMGGGDARLREAVRRAFALAAARSPTERVGSLLADASRPPEARLELLRASVGKLPEVRAAADGAIDDLLRAAPTMQTRYLIADPLAALARAGDAHATTRLLELLARDPEPAVRAHATELATGIAAAASPLTVAVTDEDPRVREAALRAVASAKLTGAASAAEGALAKDPWTFVRTAAVATLASLPPSGEVDDKLASALDNDASPRVRTATVAALAVRRAVAMIKPIRGRLDDVREDIDVRLASARALGTLCDAKSLDRLTELARNGAGPMTDEVPSQLSLASTEALGWLHPPDLARRLAPLLAKDARPLAQEAAKSALAEPPRCGSTVR